VEAKVPAFRKRDVAPNLEIGAAAETAAHALPEMPGLARIGEEMLFPGTAGRRRRDPQIVAEGREVEGVFQKERLAGVAGGYRGRGGHGRDAVEIRILRPRRPGRQAEADYPDQGVRTGPAHQRTCSRARFSRWNQLSGMSCRTSSPKSSVVTRVGSTASMITASDGRTAPVRSLKPR